MTGYNGGQVTCPINILTMVIAKPWSIHPFGKGRPWARFWTHKKHLTSDVSCEPLDKNWLCYNFTSPDRLLSYLDHWDDYHTSRCLLWTSWAMTIFSPYPSSINIFSARTRWPSLGMSISGFIWYQEHSRPNRSNSLMHPSFANSSNSLLSLKDPAKIIMYMMTS